MTTLSPEFLSLLKNSHITMEQLFELHKKSLEVLNNLPSNVACVVTLLTIKAMHSWVDTQEQKDTILDFFLSNLTSMKNETSSPVAQSVE